MEYDQQSASVLLEMYKENTAHGRHLEGQRQLATALILPFAAAAFGAAITLQFERPAAIALGAFLVALGILGAVYSKSTYTRWRESMAKAEKFRLRLGQLCPSAHIEKCLKDAGARSDLTLPLHQFWILLQASVAALGLALMLGVFKIDNPDQRPQKIEVTAPIHVTVDR
jgi:hypothetical protein